MDNVYVDLYEPCLVKRAFSANYRSFQRARSVQADMERVFFCYLYIFVHVKRHLLPYYLSDRFTSWIFQIYTSVITCITIHRDEFKNTPFCHSASHVYIYRQCPVRKELNAFAKSTDSCQPAQSAQADMSRNFSISLNFLNIKGSLYTRTKKKRRVPAR